MSPVAAHRIDAGISVAVGLLATLYGFQVIGKRSTQDGAPDQFYQRFGKLARWLGPVILVASTIRFFIER